MTMTFKIKRLFAWSNKCKEGLRVHSHSYTLHELLLFIAVEKLLYVFILSHTLRTRLGFYFLVLLVEVSKNVIHEDHWSKDYNLNYRTRYRLLTQFLMNLSVHCTLYIVQHNSAKKNLWIKKLYTQGPVPLLTFELSVVFSDSLHVCMLHKIQWTGNPQPKSMD